VRSASASRGARCHIADVTDFAPVFHDQIGDRALAVAAEQQFSHRAARHAFVGGTAGARLQLRHVQRLGVGRQGINGQCGDLVAQRDRRPEDLPALCCRQPVAATI